MDSAGNVYVASGSRVRLLTPSGPPCAYAVSPTSIQVPASGGNFEIRIQTTPSCSWAVSALPDRTTLSGASQGSGSATLTLAVAANSTATPLNATTFIAGVSVPVTQPAGCAFSMSPGGQVFPMAGGTGSITITATPGCPWTATSNESWVTVTGSNTGTGNGTLSFQVSSNDNQGPSGNPFGDRSGAIFVAGLSFAIEQTGIGFVPYTTSSMAQLAFGGGWTTTVTIINTGMSPVPMRLSFFDNTGSPLPIPLVFPQLNASAAPLLASTLDRMVNPGAALVIQTSPLPGQQTQVGWAQVVANNSGLDGFAVFQQSNGASIQEAVVPLESRKPSAFEVWFDNTGGYSTGIALANTNAQAATVPVRILDDTSLQLQSTTIVLPALGHTSFNLGQTYVMTAGRRGTVEFDVPSGGSISLLGLRFNPTGAFTTIPALAK